MSRIWAILFTISFFLGVCLIMSGKALLSNPIEPISYIPLITGSILAVIGGLGTIIDG